jgi:glycogen operon protein
VSRFVPFLLVTLLVLAGCEDEWIHIYATAPIAPSLDETGIAALDHLGPKLVDRGTNFSVYSEHATRIEVLLFDDPEDHRPTRQFALHRFGDVWSVYVEGVGVGQHYGYIAWGPNWVYQEGWRPGTIGGFSADVDAQGNRFNPNKLLTDPYAVAVHRDHDWSRGTTATGPGRTSSTWGASPKSVVVVSDYEWGPSEADWREARRSGTHAGHGPADAILYEVHLKGFTANSSSGVDHPGSFRGFGEKAAYFAELGITGVEILPIHEKPLDGGYWGYNNLSFFSPEVSYAWDSDPREVIDEFKWMVEQLHAHDIEVIVDVVYNHTGEGGLWRERIFQNDVNFDPTPAGDFYNFDPKEVAGLYNLRGLDNSAYYALSEDNQTYWNNTGVGNQTRCNHRPMKRMVLDSLHYLVEELHVDGFRFDLAPVLGASSLDPDVWDPSPNNLLQVIIDDPVLAEYNARIIAEPWSAGGEYSWSMGRFPASSDGERGWGEWNAGFRDWWRAFVNFDDWSLSSRAGDADGGFTLTGSAGHFEDDGRRPHHSVNFVTVHDGFTMYDLLSYDHKQNGCGPLNPVCCADPNSAWCDFDSGEDDNRSRNWGDEGDKRQMMRNLFAAMMVSHGTPLLLGGDEWLRTQHGNNNAYSTLADNEHNWFQWGTWQANDERNRMFDFVRAMIQVRKDNLHAFAPETYGGGAPFAWKSAGNTEPPDWNSRHLMIHYYDASAGPELVVLINLERGPVTYQLPGGRTWERLIDTQGWFDSDEFLVESGADRRTSHNASIATPEAIPGSEYTAADSSIVILRAAD